MVLAKGSFRQFFMGAWWSLDRDWGGYGRTDFSDLPWKGFDNQHLEHIAGSISRGCGRSGPICRIMRISSGPIFPNILRPYPSPCQPCPRLRQNPSQQTGKPAFFHFPSIFILGPKTSQNLRACQPISFTNISRTPSPSRRHTKRTST
jgi:hypothetical protein